MTLGCVLFIWREFILVVAGHLPGRARGPALVPWRGHKQLPPVLSSFCLKQLHFFSGIPSTFPTQAVRSPPRICGGVIYRCEGLVFCGSPVWGFYPSFFNIRLFKPGRLQLTDWLATVARVISGKKLVTWASPAAALFFQGLSACKFPPCSCSPVCSSSVLYFSRMCNYYLWESYSGISYCHSPSKALHSFYAPSDFYLKIVGAYLHLLIGFTRFFGFASFLPLLPPGWRIYLVVIAGKACELSALFLVLICPRVPLFYPHSWWPLLASRTMKLWFHCSLCVLLWMRSLL